MGWSLSLQEWPLGQDPRCPGCVFHYSPHCYPRAPRAHARAHTPGYSSRRRVSPCGPPPLSTSVGVTVTSSSDGNVRRLRVRSRWVSGGRCAPGGLLRRVGEIPTTGLPLKAARPLGRWRRWRVLVCDPFPLGGFALVMSPETAAAVVACLLCVGFLFGEETEPRRLRRWVSSAGEMRFARSEPSRVYCSLLLHCGSSLRYTHAAHRARCGRTLFGVRTSHAAADGYSVDKGR